MPNPIKRAALRLGLMRRRPEPDLALIVESSWFDAEWYRTQANALGVFDSEENAAAHYLSSGWRQGLSPGPQFDSAWYLSAYPDVAAAGLNPLVHFLKFGRHEGRLPRRNRALARDFHLWRGAGGAMAARLEALIDAPDASEEERDHARWALARWHAVHAEPARAANYLLPERRLITWPDGAAPGLLALECLHKAGAAAETLDHVLDTLVTRWPRDFNVALAQANLSIWRGAPDEQVLAPLNAAWQARGLATLIAEPGALPLMDRLRPSAENQPVAENAALASVILPIFNASASVETAIRSLFAQRGCRLEIIAVDDASSDDTLAILERLAAECPPHVTYRIIPLPYNQGAYAARNAGLAVSTGELITTHDGDDWSHPEKLRLQIAALDQSRHDGGLAVASISYWSRATPVLVCQRWRVEEEGWIHRNISSLMFRRSVFERLGYWDELRANADSEYLERVQAAFGAESLVDVEPGMPLAFGCFSEASLSQQRETHFRTQFAGIRALHMRAARRWYGRTIGQGGRLFLPRAASPRPFPVPEALLRQAVPIVDQDERDRIEMSGLFDGGWYLRRYPQLHDTRVEAFDHYWREGRFLGMDPGPNFSQSGYGHQLDDELPIAQTLSHYLEIGRAQGLSPLPELSGRQAARPGAKTLLLCGHQAGERLYGAERSLIDVASGLDELGYRLILALPEAINTEYVARLRELCHRLVIIPYGWLQRGREPEEETIGHFVALIQRLGIDAVATNSLVLQEPLSAARRCGLPTAIHLRELPRGDAALCETLNADAAWIIDKTQGAADLLIANSRFTRDEFLTLPLSSEGGGSVAEGNQTSVALAVVPNTIDMAPLLALAPPVLEAVAEASCPLRVGILSSGHVKKGLSDLEALASALEARGVAMHFVMFGTASAELEAMAQRIAEQAGRCQVELAGYVPSPHEALARVSVVLSLSHFQESFGRTALEAMAAARAFVGYRHGALPEVVEGCGTLVELGDIEALADALGTLAASPERLVRLGEMGRKRAMDRFGRASFVASLGEAYSRLFANSTG
ncbi:glycosyltransferase [Salinicola sp. DM10]|uniref:glycosyltransferase n=1 Tax=Salinicola sp. DM10 TaxID=2815721 RepID=UPI001A8F1CF2|nr:glycosyltransferase [Salinicola sp. DM10]MCE3026005.1 glycosyltransferase [Salinicola sp. DM10]